MRRLLHYAFTAVAMVAFAQNVNAQCGPQNIPVSQDFSSWPLACWNDSLGTETVQDGGGYAEFNYWSWSSGKTGILRSDTIVVTSDARVKFKWSKKLYSATSADALTLRMRNVNSATWDTIWHRSGTAFQSNDGASNTSPGSFAQEIIALNTSYTGDSVEFEFYGYSGYGSDAWVDDFLVEALPLCPEPLALGAKSITSSSATLFWQSNGTAFNVEYGPVGFIQGTGTSVTASADSVVINNLASNSCFDYYVQTDCAPNNGTSIWSGPFTFCTLCSAISTPIVENFDGATPG
ncbi:MAG: hypothetical protein N4A46_09430, partial [Schleiferiaceae bacterium]|nr:hypothetical protein [Schleiferiaceae bacterium]